VALARLAGLNHQDLAGASVDPALEMAALAVAIVSVPLTYWLSEHQRFGAVLASAMPSAVLAFGANLLSTSWQLKMIPLGAAWFGASFAGMTSVERLTGRHWSLPLIGLIYGFLSINSGPRLRGFGGGLRTTALVSMLAAFGIARLLRTKPVCFAKQMLGRFVALLTVMFPLMMQNREMFQSFANARLNAPCRK
jgi:hypothetical protein